MNAAIPTAIALVVYALGYLVYARWLAEKVYELRPDHPTPAHELEDGVDYVPTRPSVLFGHHYASIAGLAPMLGPAVAVIWGWFPAMVWVVLGALFVGCVHDFSALVLSVRAQGKSIGAVAEKVIGKRAKTLFHLIIFFLVALAMGVFVYVIAFLFTPAPSEATKAIHFPQAVMPSFGLMVIAAAIGFLGYKKGVSWKILTPIGFTLLLVLVGIAGSVTIIDPLLPAGAELKDWVKAWSGVLLVYAFLASILPVWSLLQPRDFLNSWLLYLGLGSLYVGFFVMAPNFAAPAVQLHPEGAPSMFPFVFITIACGAASGFHSLVSSGTTAKQLDKETDARVIGYGGMIGESLLGLIAVLATTAGMMSTAEWHSHYSSWSAAAGLGAKVGVFIQGCSRFLGSLGIDEYTGATFVSIIVVSYALTSLDSATRLLRYNVEEIAEGFGLGFLGNRYVSSIVAISAIAFFAFYEVDGKSAGLALWGLFGTTNQILAGLALLAATLYLLVRRKPWWVTGIPMIAMLGTTIFAMGQNALTFYEKGHWLLFGVGALLLVLAVWLVIEAVIALSKHLRSGEVIETLDL